MRPPCLDVSGSVRAIRIPYWTLLGAGGPHLLSGDDPLVAVAHRPGAEVGEIAARAGLGEQLAPDLLAGQQREQEPVLLLVGAGVDDGRAGPADADHVGRPLDPGGLQLLVDEDLVDRIGVEAPRLRPVRGDVAGLGQLAARGRRILAAYPAPGSRRRRGSSGPGKSKSTNENLDRGRISSPESGICRYHRKPGDFPGDVRRDPSVVPRSRIPRPGGRRTREPRRTRHPLR